MPNTIQFYFQLVEKVEHVQTFQLIEINFEFVQNVIFFCYYIEQLHDFKKSNSTKWIV